MPIEVTCDSCRRRLRVKDETAGRRIKCPQCEAVIRVPDGSGLPDQWHVKTSEGADYGPVSRSELDTWCQEGRLDAQCQLLQAGASHWQWATEVYPTLAAQPAAKEPAAAVTPVSPPNFASPAPAVQENPFDFASQPSRSVSYSGQLSDKSKVVAGLLGLFLGQLGVHRFYLGYTGIGLAMLFTAGGCGIWALIDSIMIFAGSVRDSHGRVLRD